jgi:hypothetical protein
MTRDEILENAGDLINGDRAADYGDAKENFENIGAGWRVIDKYNIPYSVKVALKMDWLKTCRLLTSPDHLDSWVDKCGYSALGGEIATASQEQKFTMSSAELYKVLSPGMAELFGMEYKDHKGTREVEIPE